MRLLFDAHMSQVLATRLRVHDVDVEVLASWRGGEFLRGTDEDILSASVQEGRVLVTYDCHTVVPLLVKWAEDGRDHSGVILVDDRTIRPDDIGGLLRALVKLHEDTAELDWRNRAVFLERPG